MMKSEENHIEISGTSRLFPLYCKSFSQVQIRDTFILPKKKPDIKSILKVNTSININDTYITLTSRATSNELQSLTGKMAFVAGEAIQKIEYRVEDIKKITASVQLKIFFSSYITLDEAICIDEDCKIEVTPYIENIYAKQIGKRKVINNIMLLLVAKNLS